MKKRILILGCGYLGEQILKDAINENYQVDLLTRNPQKCDLLIKLGANKAICSQLESREWHSKLPVNKYQAIIVCVGSSESTPAGYEQSYIRGLASVSGWIGEFPAKLIYTSSVSVYGNSDGEWVNEETDPAPNNWRGKLIYQSEGILKSLKYANYKILRLGGIYGEGRNRFISGMQMPETDGYVNLIHVKDASSAIIKLITSSSQEMIMNLTDNSPILRSEIVKKGRELFQASENKPYMRKKRQTPNRRIRAEKIQNELTWKPLYKSVIEAIREMAQ